MLRSMSCATDAHVQEAYHRADAFTREDFITDSDPVRLNICYKWGCAIVFSRTTAGRCLADPVNAEGASREPVAVFSQGR
jgi:hypothetical protein